MYKNKCSSSRKQREWKEMRVFSLSFGFKNYGSFWKNIPWDAQVLGSPLFFNKNTNAFGRKSTLHRASELRSIISQKFHKLLAQKKTLVRLYVYIQITMHRQRLFLCFFDFALLFVRVIVIPITRTHHLSISGIVISTFYCVMIGKMWWSLGKN